MRGRAVTEEVEVFGHGVGVDTVLYDVLTEIVVTVFALCAARNFDAFEKQVVRFGKRGVVVLFHGIERAGFGREVDYEHEVAAELVFDVLANEFFAVGIEIAFERARHFVIHLVFEYAIRVGEGNARDFVIERYYVVAEVFFVFVVELRFDAVYYVREKCFLDVHDVVVRVDERHFDVDARELGVVTGSKAGVGAEVFADLERAVEARHHRHLLVKLRALREVRFLSEVVFKLENLAAALARKRGDLGRVYLDKTVVVEELDGKPLERRLDLEHEQLLFVAEVYPTVVHAQVLTALGVERNEVGYAHNVNGGGVDFFAAVAHVF